MARAFVFATRPGDSYRTDRTLRSLEAAGLGAEQIGPLTGAKLRELLREGAPLVLVRAGAWLARTDGFKLPASSATGHGLCALGALRAPQETEPETAQSAQLWRDLFVHTGGDFTRLLAARAVPGGAQCNGDSTLRTLLTSLPRAASSLFLDSLAASALARHGVSSLEQLIQVSLEQLRVVHYAPLDVYDDAGLRVLQVITALQRGGAERVTLDLVSELPAQNVRARLATLGRPVREAFAAPPRTLDLSRAGTNPESRATALYNAANTFGADLLHAHLLSADDLRHCSARGIPVVATIHNTRPGWPQGLDSLRARDATLLVACARAVEADLRAVNTPVPVRTAWNGIDFTEFQLTPARLAAGREWRRKWGFGEDDFVLIAVANPRPQKRLHLLPGILAALRARLGPTCGPTHQQPALSVEARLVFCGEAMRGNPEAEACVAQTRAETTRLGLEPHVRWTGPVSEIPEILAAADALVCPSAHEGLSLAQLEALAMGCAVVATDVGGAREVAADNPDFLLLPADASAEQFAEVLAGLVPFGGTASLAAARESLHNPALLPDPDSNCSCKSLPEP